MEHWKKILALAIPSILSFATATVSGTVNLILVGQMGALVIAIVGVSNIIMYNAWALFSGLGHTVNYLVAQNYGANQMDKAIGRTQIALRIGFIFGLGILAAGYFGARPVLQFMGGSSEFVSTGGPYLQLRFIAMALSILIFVYQGFLRGIGDVKSPMILTVISNAAMVLFTYGLAFGHWGMPELGLAGAGWGMLIGEGVGLLGSMYVYYMRVGKQFPTRRLVRPKLLEVKLITAESAKLGVQEFAMSIAMLIFTRFVMELGTSAVAANEIALNVMAFGFMPAFAFGATASILVGQEIGRGFPLLARKLGTETVKLGGLFVLAIGIVEFILAGPIAKVYTQDPDVFLLTAALIRTAAFLQLFDAVYCMFAGALRGTGDTSFLFKMSLLLSWAVFVPLAYLFVFVFHWGSLGAWVSLYLFLAMFALAVAIRFFQFDWQNIRLKEAEGVVLQALD